MGMGARPCLPGDWSLSKARATQLQRHLPLAFVVAGWRALPIEPYREFHLVRCASTGNELLVGFVVDLVVNRHVSIEVRSS